MRDVATVPVGEHVTVKSAGYPVVPVIDGTFMGAVNGRVLIDVDPQHLLEVDLSSVEFDVWDMNGQIIGHPVLEPVLETIPPDLE